MHKSCTPGSTKKYIYLYGEAESTLRVSARLTAVHRGGIVLSVAIHIKSKALIYYLPYQHLEVRVMQPNDTDEYGYEPERKYVDDEEDAAHGWERERQLRGE